MYLKLKKKKKALVYRSWKMEMPCSCVPPWCMIGTYQKGSHHSLAHRHSRTLQASTNIQLIFHHPK